MKLEHRSVIHFLASFFFWNNKNILWIEYMQRGLKLSQMSTKKQLKICYTPKRPHNFFHKTLLLHDIYRVDEPYQSLGTAFLFSYDILLRALIFLCRTITSFLNWINSCEDVHFCQMKRFCLEVLVLLEKFWTRCVTVESRMLRNKNFFLHPFLSGKDGLG